MIFFKTNRITGYSPEEIERGIRRFTFKRHIRLDFHSSVTYMKEDKYFFGIETFRDIQLTRIKTPLERFLPKLIFSFSKEESFMTYRIRYDYVSLITFFLLLSSAVFTLVDALRVRS